MLENGRYGIWCYSMYRNNEYFNECALHHFMFNKYVDLETGQVFVAGEFTYDITHTADPRELAEMVGLLQTAYISQPDVHAYLDATGETCHNFNMIAACRALEVSELENDGSDRVRFAYLHCSRVNMFSNLWADFWVVYAVGVLHDTANEEDEEDLPNTEDVKSMDAMTRLNSMRDTYVDSNSEIYDKYALGDILYDVTQRVCDFMAANNLSNVIKCARCSGEYFTSTHSRFGMPIAPLFTYSEKLHIVVPLNQCSDEDELLIDVMYSNSVGLLYNSREFKWPFGERCNQNDIINITLHADDEEEAMGVFAKLLCIDGMEYAVDKARKVNYINTEGNTVVCSYVGYDEQQPVVGCFYLLKVLDHDSKICDIMTRKLFDKITSNYEEEYTVDENVRYFNAIHDLITMLYDGITA